MKLTYEQIRTLATGAVDSEITDRGLHLYRFTPAQRKLEHPYIPTLEAMYRGSAGIKLCFGTDSRSLHFRADLSEPCTRRSICALDVLVDGVWAGGWENCPQATPNGGYSDLVCPMGVADVKLDLAEGWKEVCIYLPWSACSVIEELMLEDGARVEAAVPERTLLCFGDSITMGCHALRPSCSYAARLARALGAQEFNKALAGGVSFPELTAIRDELDPDVITVAYGTNDWRKASPERFVDCYGTMLRNLRGHYPNAPIFAITPLWRRDIDGNTQWPDFGLVERYIRQLANEVGGVHVVCGMELVPHDPAFFADRQLHPNDVGFERYAQGLLAAIREKIEE